MSEHGATDTRPVHTIDRIRIDSWNQYLQAFGKAYIFDRRILKYSRCGNWLKVLGIIVPVVVGGTAIGYGKDSDFIGLAVTIAIPLSIVQLVLSVLSVIYRWDDELSYAIEASMHYNRLSSQYEDLAKYAACEKSAQKEFESLNGDFRIRTERDARHSIREWENRRGMRYALRDRQRKCAGCGNIPTSMESTDCTVCGRFESDLWKGIKKWTSKLHV